MVSVLVRATMMDVIKVKGNNRDHAMDKENNHKLSSKEYSSLMHHVGMVVVMEVGSRVGVKG